MNRPTAISWWIGVPLGLLLLVILLLSLVDLFDRRLLADPLASLVEEQTGRALQIGDFDLRWGWPMSLQAEEVSLANADWGSDVPLLRADVVSALVNPFEVLDGPPYADLQLQDLQVLIQRSEAGEWNWMIDTGRAETDEAPRLPVTVAADGGEIIYEMPETLAIELQHFSLAAGGDGELVLKLRASRAGTPLAVDGTFAAAQGKWDGAAALRAGESTLSSRFRVVTGAEPLRVRAHIDSGVLAPARLAELKPARESESSEASVTLPRLDEIDAEIGFDVATLRLPDLDIQNIRGRLGIKDGFAQLTDLVAYVGKARLEGGIAVDTTAQQPEIRITADLPRVPLSSLPDSLPLSAQPGDIAAQVDARLGTPGRQLPLTPVALLSQLTIPESRFLYARRTEEEAVFVSRLQVQPGVEPSVSLALRGVDAPPFKATLSAPPLEELADQSGYPVRLTVTTEGARARIDAELGEMLQENGFNLAFYVSGDKLPEVPALSFTPPPVPEFSLSGELQQESGRWAVGEFDLSYGPSQLSGNAIYDPEEEPPSLALDVEASLLDLTAIPRNAPIQTEEEAKGSAGGWVPDGIADALREIDAEVELSADRIKVTDEYSLNEVELAALLEQGRLRADPVSFTAAGGSVRGSLSADALQPVEGRLSLDLGDLEPRQLHSSLAPLQEHFGRVSGELHVAVAEAPPGQKSEHTVLQSLARLSVDGTRLRFQQPDANTDLTVTLASNGGLSAPDGERGISIQADGRYRGDAIQLELEGEPPLELRDPHDPYELQTQVEYADSDLRGDVTLDLSAAAPAVTASLRSNALKLDDVLGLTSGGESGETDRAAGNEAESRKILSQQQFDFDLLRRANFDIEYNAGEVDAAGILFDNVAAQVILQDGHLLAEPVSLEMAEGTATLRIDMHTRESLLEGVFDFDARGVSLSEMLSNVDIASNSFGIVGGQGKFWVRGDSLASVIGSADGGLMLAMTGGQLDSLLVELAGLDIGEAALAASGLYNPARIDCAWASLHSTGGILDVDQFVIDTDDTVFFLNGTVDLGEETLDLALFSEAKDPSFPTTNSPLAFTGSLKQPVVDLVTGELAARALGAAALAALVGPLAAALPFIELGLQEDPDVCEGWVEKLQSERHDE